MRRLVLLALVGLAAQLVDGSLGMGYGVTSATLLVAGGVGPAAGASGMSVALLASVVFTLWVLWVSWAVKLEQADRGADFAAA